MQNAESVQAEELCTKMLTDALNWDELTRRAHPGCLPTEEKGAGFCRRPTGTFFYFKR